MTPDSAVIFKTIDAAGPAWIDDFPDGFSCAVCDRNAQPALFRAADCTFVTIERIFDNPCNLLEIAVVDATGRRPHTNGR